MIVLLNLFFKLFLSPYFNLYHTFNAKKWNGNLLYNTDNGQIVLLELQHYVHSHQYVPYFSDGISIIFIYLDLFLLFYVAVGLIAI